MYVKTLSLGLAALMSIFFQTYAEARGGSHSKRGYVKRDGTYVAPSRATNPNSTKIDNWSTKGNTNPYTGKQGTKSAF